MKNVICGRCVKCGKEYPAVPNLTNCECGGILDIIYDYDYIKAHLTKEMMAERKNNSMWRYRELLPVEEDTPDTPCLLYTSADGFAVRDLGLLLVQDLLFQTQQVAGGSEGETGTGGVVAEQGAVSYTHLDETGDIAVFNGQAAVVIIAPVDLADEAASVVLGGDDRRVDRAAADIDVYKRQPNI